MAISSMFNVRLFVGGVDLTTRSNRLELMTDVEEIDVTTFHAEEDENSGWKEVIPGLNSTAVTAEGFWEAGSTSKVDDSMWASMGSIDALTIGVDGAAVADTAYLTQVMRAQYKLLGQLGQANKWTFAGSGSAPLARGVILHPPGTAVTTTGDGTAVEHVAVSSGQRLYATLHVVSASGETPLLTVKVESDADADFDGSETVRITFDEADGIEGQFKSVAGAISDTFYRVTHTTAGTSASFLYVCAVGVM